MPVEGEERGTTIDLSFRRKSQTPAISVVVDDVTLPADVTPWRIARARVVHTSHGVQRASTDVIDRSANINNRYVGRVGFHAEVTIDMNLRNPIDLIESPELLRGLSVEQEEISRRIREQRRTDRVDDLAVPGIQ